MKKMKIKLLLCLAGLFLTSCGPENPSVNYKAVGTDGNEYNYKVVVIDGNEYFACRTYGGNYVLCPKLQAKESK
jgi:hypothetical protein